MSFLTFNEVIPHVLTVYHSAVGHRGDGCALVMDANIRVHCMDQDLNSLSLKIMQAWYLALWPSG